MIDLERPDWHRDAACSGDRRWLAEPGRGQSLEPLRRVCRACPVAAECLREGLGLPSILRSEGVLRAGVNGRQAWRRVEALADELQPASPADWAAFAAWVVDDDLAEVAVAVRTQRVRKPRAGTRRRISVAGSFPTLRQYSVPSGGLTRTELLAARATG